MRKELFNAIKAKLASDVPEVQHIDLWNHNVEFVEQEEGWARPMGASSRLCGVWKDRVVTISRWQSAWQGTCYYSPCDRLG